MRYSGMKSGGMNWNPHERSRCACGTTVLMTLALALAMLPSLRGQEPDAKPVAKRESIEFEGRGGEDARTDVAVVSVCDDGNRCA
jgi:hypothetical protein